MRTEDDWTVLDVAGGSIYRRTRSVRDRLRLIRGVRHLVVDLTDVGFMDSSYCLFRPSDEAHGGRDGGWACVLGRSRAKVSPSRLDRVFAIHGSFAEVTMS
jgi:hypothetical protein